MTLLAGGGQVPMNGLRIDRDSEQIVYAAIKMTIVIFRLDGGATTVFKCGRLNHVSNPVALFVAADNTSLADGKQALVDNLECQSGS